MIADVILSLACPNPEREAVSEDALDQARSWLGCMLAAMCFAAWVWALVLGAELLRAAQFEAAWVAMFATPMVLTLAVACACAWALARLRPVASPRETAALLGVAVDLRCAWVVRYVLDVSSQRLLTRHEAARLRAALRARQASIGRCAADMPASLAG